MSIFPCCRGRNSIAFQYKKILFRANGGRRVGLIGYTEQRIQYFLSITYFLFQSFTINSCQLCRYLIHNFPSKQCNHFFMKISQVITRNLLDFLHTFCIKHWNVYFELARLETAQKYSTLYNASYNWTSRNFIHFTKFALFRSRSEMMKSFLFFVNMNRKYCKPQSVHITALDSVYQRG